MIQIPAEFKAGPKEVIDLRIQDPGLDFEKARALAKKKAHQLRGETMLLSWHNALTGEYHPTFDCGGSEKPAWVLYADSRGANLTIRINDGAFTFMFLTLEPDTKD